MSDFLDQLTALIADRKANPKQGSYTNELLADPAKAATSAKEQAEADLQVTIHPDERRALWHRVIRSHAENVWIIPTTERGIAIGVLANDFRNVPEQAVSSWITMTPGNLNPETFYISSEQ